MAGTITTYERCVANFETKEFATGTKEEILAKFVTYRFEGRKLFIKIKGYKEFQSTSFSEEFTPEEMYKEVVKTAFNELCQQPHYKCYRDIGFGN